MGKLTTYILLLSGILLFFYFGGLLSDSTSTTNTLLQLLLAPEDIANSTLAEGKAALAIQAIILGGIVVGALFAGNLDLIALSSFSLYILNLLWSFMDVYNKLASENKVLAILIFGPLMMLLVVTVLEWWRGRD